MSLNNPSEEEILGNRPPLPRNTACHQCRKRKLKCDATRPICVNCLRPRQRGAAAREPNPDCTWDDAKEVLAPTRVRKKTGQNDEGGDEESAGAKKAKVAELEGRVAAFEKALQIQQSTVPPPVANHRAELQFDSLSHAMNPFDPQQQDIIYNPTATSATFMSGPSGTLGANQSLWGTYPPTSTAAPVNGVEAVNDDQQSHDLGHAVFDLVWPDWPADLPSPSTVELIVNTFFERVPTYPKMIHKSTFLANLQLAPSNANYPALALIHAILAATAPFLAVTLLTDRSCFPMGTPWNQATHPMNDFELTAIANRNIAGTLHQAGGVTIAASTPLGQFQMWHRRKALALLAVHFDRGEKLLQVLQAQIIVTVADQMNAWWTDCWMSSGSSVRMAIPMRINESTKQLPEDTLDRDSHMLLPPSADQLETAQRERTWWMAFIIDRSITFNTTWADGIANEEITVELPVSQEMFDAGVGDLTGVQNIHSPELFSAHPPCHVDGLVFLIKALKLYSDVNRFYRKYIRGSHSIVKYVSDPSVRLLMSQINSFRLSFPAHLRKPTQRVGSSGERYMDGDLLSAIMVTHAATLSLSEPLITKDTWQTEGGRTGLSAIRAILSLIYDITATSFEISLLPSNAACTWSMCARGLCRFIQAATLTGDLASASVFMSELQVFRLAMQQYGERFPLGVRQVKMLDDALATMNIDGPTTRRYYECTNDKVFDPAFTPSQAAWTRTTATSEAGSRGARIITPSASLSGPSASASTSAMTPPSRQNSNSGQTPVDGGTNNNFGPGQTSGPSSGGENFAGTGTDFMFGVDTSDWFDISSFSFDTDALVGLIPEGETFEGGTQSMFK